MFCLYYNCHFQKRPEDKTKSGGILERRGLISQRPGRTPAQPPSLAPGPPPPRAPAPRSTPYSPERGLQEGPCPRSPPCVPSGIWSQHKCLGQGGAHTEELDFTPDFISKAGFPVLRRQNKGETTEQREEGTGL